LGKVFHASEMSLMRFCASSPPRSKSSAPYKLEKRETLVATGYAVISVQNHKNPTQQLLLAIRASKLDAYRSLTEQVHGQQLDASTNQLCWPVRWPAQPLRKAPAPPNWLPGRWLRLRCRRS
jgi:hypothetical protein